MWADTLKQAALDSDSRIAIFRSMNTTVDLPEDALAEAMKHAKVKTKTDGVEVESDDRRY